MILSVEREKAIKSSRIANNTRANHANVLSVEQEKKHSLSMAASEKKLQALAAAERARREEETASSQASTASSARTLNSSSARTHESLQERAIQQRTTASDRLKKSVATSLSSREKAVEEENARLEAELEHKLAERAAFQQRLQQVRSGTNRVSFGINLTTLPFEADTENRDRNAATPAEKTKNGTPIDEQLATLEIGGRRRGGQMTLGAVRSSQSEISSLLSWS